MEKSELKSLTAITSIFQDHFFDFLDKRAGKELLFVNKQISENVKNYASSRRKKYKSPFELPAFQDVGGCLLLTYKDDETFIPKSESVKWIIETNPITKKEVYLIEYLDGFCNFKIGFRKDEFIYVKESYNDYISIIKSKCHKYLDTCGALIFEIKSYKIKEITNIKEILVGSP